MAKVHEEAMEISLITSLEYGEIKNLNLYVGPVEVMTGSQPKAVAFPMGAAVIDGINPLPYAYMIRKPRVS